MSLCDGDFHSHVWLPHMACRSPCTILYARAIFSWICCLNPHFQLVHNPYQFVHITIFPLYPQLASLNHHYDKWFAMSPVKSHEIPIAPPVDHPLDLHCSCLNLMKLKIPSIHPYIYTHIACVYSLRLVYNCTEWIQTLFEKVLNPLNHTQHIS